MAVWQSRAPVDDVSAAIDQALLMQADEGFAHGARQAGIHSEILARPVDGGAEALHLVEDGAPPYCSFQHQTRFKNASRPSLWREVFSSASWRSTIIWVAMPAWSVPGTQRVRSPRMRCQRARMSISVWLSMWPMCSRPVTLGGGSSMVKLRCVAAFVDAQ